MKRIEITLLVVLLCISPSLLAQEASLIRKDNMPSVLYLHATLRSKDGGMTLKSESGSGFILTANGQVLTAGHVIPQVTDDGILVIEGHRASAPLETFNLELITRDFYLDLALLQLPDPGAAAWRPVEWGDSSTVPDDAPLYALGFEMQRFSSSQGFLRTKYGPNGKWNTSLPINHGDSGGPVFDLTGKVVAVSAGGYDESNSITVVTPESFTRGLRQLAIARPAREQVVALGPAKVSKVFQFYKSVDSEVTAPQDVSEQYCLDEGFLVTGVKDRVTTLNGPTKLISVVKTPSRANCVDLKAIVTGQGVDRIGPIIVNHRGRGWLGVEVTVEGQKAK